MASISIRTPTDSESLTSPFPASGEYSTLDLDDGTANSVTSSLLLGDSLLNEETFKIPSGSSSGEWSVTHTVAGGPYSGVTLIARLYVNGEVAATASVGNLSINAS